MDDALVARWRDGDSTATTAVRNHVRTHAERVLSHPALRAAEGSGGRSLQRNDERRRELTSTIAREVMQRPVSSAAQLDAMSLMAAARHAVDVVREGRTISPGAHLPSHTVVTVSLAPGGLPPAARSAAERHIGECGACAADSRMVGALVRSGAAPAEEPEPEPEEAEPEDDTAAAMAAALAEVEAEERAPDPGSGRASVGRPLVLRPPPVREGAGWKAALPFVVAAGIGLWWVAGREDGPLPAARVAEIAALADRSPPTLSGDAVPEDALPAASELARGDCRTASARLRTARMRAPDDAALWSLEAASFVCAGEGKDALSALDGLAERGLAAPVSAAWTRAQALLLIGDLEGAEDALDAVIASDPTRASAARAQRASLQALDD